MRQLIIGLICLLLIACQILATTSPYQAKMLTTWRGQTIQAFEALWGAPDIVVRDSYNNERYTFVIKRNVTVSATNELQTCRTMLLVDQQHFIQDIKSTGELCDNDSYVDDVLKRSSTSDH